METTGLGLIIVGKKLTMTEDYLKAIEERIARTTSGKWVREGGYIYPESPNRPCVIDCLSQRNAYWWEGNAAFICAAREDLTALIAEVRMLRAKMAMIVETAQTAIGGPTPHTPSAVG
jgi:hypothetical protein